MYPTTLTLCFLTLLAPTWLGPATNDNGGSLVAHGFTSQSMISSLPALSKSLGSETSRRRRPYGYYATTDEEQKSLQTEIETINGDSEASHLTTPGVNGDDAMIDSVVIDSVNSTDTIDLASIASDMNTSMVELLDEISQRINDGSSEIVKDINSALDAQLTQLPDAKAQELTEYVTDLAYKIQKAQQDEVERQLEDLEKLLRSPIEKVAFSDAPLFDLKESMQDSGNRSETAEAEIQLILAGTNSTLKKSASESTTKDLIQNFNVAPFYYSVALFYRWASKSKNTITIPSLYLLSAYKGIANVIKTGGKKGRRKERTRGRRRERKEAEYEEFMKDAESFQSGWKRTGEIAAKGSWAKKWAVLRRSAEVWAYFSSFYLKDRRICKKFETGRWSEEKFTAERSRLGAEVTQNLLRLGPTFIKVSNQNILFFLMLYIQNSDRELTQLHFYSFRLANYSPLESILFRKSILNS